MPCPKETQKIIDSRTLLFGENIVHIDSVGLMGGQVYGNTDDTWSTVIRWNCMDVLGHKRVSIRNNHATNPLEYKIITSGLSDESTPQIMSAGNMDTNLYGKSEVVTELKVMVKNHVLGDNASYIIEVFGLRS